MRIAITGATGLLGRNVLFEFLKRHAQSGEKLEIMILGRDSENESLASRISQILQEDGVHYIFGNDDLKDGLDYLNAGNRYQCIGFDLGKPNLGIEKSGMATLKGRPIDIFFHIAGKTDFRDSAQVIESLEEENVRGTCRILQLVNELDVGTFVYTSTAYVCGLTSGLIHPDAINPDQKFRNPYEISKLKAEVLVREFARSRDIRCHIFRPSTICGRLIEAPLGTIHKFDAFYEWIGFFLRLKLKLVGNKVGPYEEMVSLDGFRGCWNEDSGLNLVPADYAAKVMYEVCQQPAVAVGYHLAAQAETLYPLLLGTMLSEIGVTGVCRVDDIPEDLTRHESLYYRHAGKIFTPYGKSRPMDFDTTNLDGLLGGASVLCPHVDKENLAILLAYAKKQFFGVCTEARKERKKEMEPDGLFITAMM